MGVKEIVLLVVLALMVGFVIWRNYETGKGDAEVKEFLNSIADKIEGIILDNLDDIDFGDFSNISEIEQRILNNIIDQVFTIVKDSLVKEVSDKFVRTLLEKYLTREIIEQFVQQIFMSASVQTVYTQKYNRALVSSSMAVKYVDPDLLEDETVAENLKLASEKIDPKTVPVDWASVIEAEELKDVQLNPATEDGSGVVSDLDEVENEDQ